MSQPPIIEGDNVTLKCTADGNPPPRSFFFHIKVSQIPLFILQMSKNVSWSTKRSKETWHLCSRRTQDFQVLVVRGPPKTWWSQVEFWLDHFLTTCNWWCHIIYPLDKFKFRAFTGVIKILTDINVNCSLTGWHILYLMHA